MRRLLLFVLVPLLAACGGEAVLPPPSTPTSDPTASPATTSAYDELVARYELCRVDAKSVLEQVKPQLGAIGPGTLGAAARAQKFSVELRTSLDNLRTRCRQLVPGCPTIVDEFVATWTKIADRLVSTALGDLSDEPFPQTEPDSVHMC